MRAIFVSYRSADSQSEVAGFCDELSRVYGKDEVVLDTRAFSHATEWLPQIRAGVAGSDAVIAAIGPAWIASFRGNTRTKTDDFVVEELNLARRIGIPVVPVLLGGVVPANLLELPTEISWIQDIHCFVVNPASSASRTAAVQNIGRIAGLASEADERSRKLNRTTVTFRALWHSMVKPFRSGARALQPTTQALLRAATLLLLALSFFLVSMYLQTQEFSSQKLLQIALASLAVSTLLMLLALLLSRAVRGKMRLMSIGAWSIQLTATTLLVYLTWSTVAWLLLPSDFFSSISHATESGQPRGDQVRSVLEHVTPSAQAVLLTFGSVSFGHIAFVVWGYSWAAATVSGWRRKSTFVLALAVVTGLIAAVVGFASGVQVWRGKNLPGPAYFRYGLDQQTPDGYIRAKLYIEARGWVELQGNEVVVRIDTLKWENRAQPKFNAFIWCNLGIWKDGRLDWPNPMSVSEIQFLGVAQPGTTYTTSRAYSLRLKLSSETRSDLTRLECSFGDRFGGHWRIDDNNLSTLRW